LRGLSSAAPQNCYTKLFTVAGAAAIPGAAAVVNFLGRSKKQTFQSSTHFGVEFADYIVPRAIPGVIQIFVFQTNYFKRFFLPLYV
jgi:hypothetical protein